MESHPTINWPEPAAWAMTLGSTGRILILLAGVLFLLSATLYVRNSKAHEPPKLARKLFVAGAFGFFGAFAVLITLLITKQYQFVYVFKHTDNLLPDLGYRIAAAWGGQEGSFLLWACTSALFSVLAIGRTGRYQPWFGFTCAVFLAALAGILSYESPFNLVAMKDLLGFDPGKIMVPPDGAGLTPALLNYWMKIHPPTIFLGFGSLTVLYAWAVAALITGDLKTWLQPVRSWALVSLTLTGIGLIMGGFWAYETLGWGGFWMWDPVENASMVPWLCVAAFIHLLFVAIAQSRWLIGTAVIGGLGFLAFNYGTFLTRSGMLGDTSVHSFAEMNRQALWLLTGLKITAAVALIGLAFWRGARYRKSGEMPREHEPISFWNLKNAYAGGATLLVSMAVTCALGMSVPLFMSLQGQQPKVVEEFLYNRVMTYMFLPTVILMGIAPFLTWRGQPRNVLAQNLINILGLTLGFLGIGIFMLRGIPQGMELPPDAKTSFGFMSVPTVLWVLILSFFCLFAIIANLYRIVEIARVKRTSIGSFLTHVGVIVALLGLIVSRGLQRKEQFQVQQGAPAVALGYVVNLEGTEGDFFTRENKVKVRFNGRGESFVAQPTLFYTDRGEGEPQPTVRPWIRHGALHDKYVSIFPMAYQASDPFKMKEGQVTRFENIAIRYDKLVREGQAGQAGTSFGAKLTVEHPVHGQVVLTPKLQLTGNGPPIPVRAQLFDEYWIMLDSMDAKDRSVTLEIQYYHPIFPLEIYYKPLPGLVWWGAGIMTFGGFLAAWQRRTKRKDLGPRTDSLLPESKEADQYATVATAQS